MDLSKFLEENPNLNDEQKRHFVVSLIDVFNELHNRGVVHRDVKSKNVLAEKDDNGNSNPILIDLGLAVSLEEKRSIFSGTPEFFAPEYAGAYYKSLTGKDISAEKVTQPKIDIWGLGLMLYHIYTGKQCPIIPTATTPLSKVLLINSLTQLEINELDLFTKNPSNPYVRMIHSMLQVDPKDRTTAAQLKMKCDRL